MKISRFLEPPKKTKISSRNREMSGYQGYSMIVKPKQTEAS